MSDETGVRAHVEAARHGGPGRLVLVADDGRNIDILVIGSAHSIGITERVGRTLVGGRLTLRSRDEFVVEGATYLLGDLGSIDQQTFPVNSESHMACTVCTERCEEAESQPRYCGNGVVEESEACDDGNLVDNDGCDSHCQLDDLISDAPGGAGD